MRAERRVLKAISAARMAGSAACVSLPPKPPPIRRQMQNHLRELQAETMSHNGLDFARVLRGGMHRDLARLAGNRECGLCSR